MSRGGARAGSGRPKSPLAYPLNVKISEEAREIMNNVKHKSEYIDRLIKEAK